MINFFDNINTNIKKKSYTIDIFFENYMNLDKIKEKEKEIYKENNIPLKKCLKDIYKQHKKNESSGITYNNINIYFNELKKTKSIWNKYKSLLCNDFTENIIKRVIINLINDDIECSVSGVIKYVSFINYIDISLYDSKIDNYKIYKYRYYLDVLDFLNEEFLNNKHKIYNSPIIKEENEQSNEQSNDQSNNNIEHSIIDPDYEYLKFVSEKKKLTEKENEILHIFKYGIHDTNNNYLKQTENNSFFTNFPSNKPYNPFFTNE